MKKIILIIAAFLFFLGVINYPFISQIYNNSVSGNVVASYEEAVESLSDKEKTAAMEAAHEYNRRLATGGTKITDAFTNGSTGSEEYNNLLNVRGDGMMGIIDIPKINVNIPIYHGTDEETALQKGAGHLEGSSLPVGGESTHAVISAHRGLPTKELFTSLDLMEEGDRFTIKVLGQTLTYEVYSIETVLPSETSSLNIQRGRDLVTLVTCTPYGRNTHRLLVHAERVDTEEDEKTYTEEVVIQPQSWQSMLRDYGFIALDIFLLAWLVFLVVVMWRREKRKKKKHKNKK